MSDKITTTDLKKIIKSIIFEVKAEMKNKKADTKDKKNDENPAKDYLNQEKDKYRKDVDNDGSENINKLMSSIKGVVSKIGKNIEVIYDDHKDIMVRQEGVFYIRINPKWEGYFDVEAYKNLSDRIYAIGLNYDQVLNFIKVNFVAKVKSYVQSAYDKSMENLEDKTTKKAKELPATEPIKQMEVPKKDIENAVTDKKDEPNAEMQPVDDKKVKKQSEFEDKKPENMAKSQKISKKEVDGDLTKNWKK